MKKYINKMGDSLLVIEDMYIIYDKNDGKPNCEIYDDSKLEEYISSGFEVDKYFGKRNIVGICLCSREIYEGNRIKARDYFECPKCKKVLSRNDLIN